MATPTTHRLGLMADDLERWQAARTLEALWAGGFGPWRAAEIVEDRSELRFEHLLKALVEGAVDAVVGSAPELPAALPEEIQIAATLPRGVVNDALVCHQHLGFHDLPGGATVGVSSARQAGQLSRLRRELKIHPVRGSIHSCLGMIDAGDLDAVLLPWVELRRLGLAWRVDDVFGVTELLPRPALAITVVLAREGDGVIAELAAISHESTSLRLRVERAFTDALNPELRDGVAALSSDYGREGMRLVGRIVAADGSQMIEAERNIRFGEPPEVLGEKVAKELLERGAAGFSFQKV